MKNEYTNSLGQTIKVGDFVAYPCRQGSGMWISYGVVSELTVRECYWKTEKDPVVKIITASGKERWDSDKREYVTEAVKARKLSISVFDRMIVVDINTIDLPSDAMTILRTAQGVAKVLGTK